MSNDATSFETLDTRGLLCPLPVIRTQDYVKTLKTGTLLEISASDPGVLHDIPAWCRVHGHELIDSKQVGDDFLIRLRVCAN
ncbi:MAG: sulfurtransferase TusA family protein [Pseudomonadales bacterium]|nr:sulfurtransferase TusA family protein [Pseudomonadales bacterium]